jgi:hypothetical protein
LSDNRDKGAIKKEARACTACYDAVFPVIESATSMDSSTASMPSAGTLSSLPVWKTTKQSSYDSSVLELLGGSGPSNVTLTNDIPGFTDSDGLDEIPGDDISRSPRLSNRRFSTPVIALQTPVIMSQSHQEATRSNRLSIPVTLPSNI